MLPNPSSLPHVPRGAASAPGARAPVTGARPAGSRAAGVAPRVAQQPASPKPLTRIERALLHALRTGASNKALALQMGKSSHTVRNQLSALFAKIGVGNRTQALVWLQAQSAGLALLGATPVSSDRFFGTSVLLPCVAAPGTIPLHAAPAPATAADSFRRPPG